MTVVRRVTVAEAEHFQEHGWVVLRELVDPEVIAGLLTIAKGVMGELAENPVRSVFPDAVKMWRRYDEPWRELPEFEQLGRSPTFAAALADLAGRPAGVRYWNDQLAVKVPPDRASTDETPWHQDSPYLPIDRVGDLTVWVAMHDMEPAHGTMRFLDRSHEVGPLDATLLVDDLREMHSELWDCYAITEPFSLRAGDATVHDGCLIHCAPPNTMPTCRWAYISEYVPGDARAARLPARHTDAAGIIEGESFDHPSFPLTLPSALVG